MSELKTPAFPELIQHWKGRVLKTEIDSYYRL